MSAYPSITLNKQTTSAPLVIAPPQNLFMQSPPSYSLGLICTVYSGANLTYSVQVTADQVPSPSGFWNDHDVVFGQTDSINSNIGYPITGIRLVVTAYTGGTVNLGVAQWP